MKTSPTTKAHHGRNIKRLREMLGIKQEVLATGLAMSQQNISLLEQRKSIDNETIEQVASLLCIPANAIRNMTDESTLSYIQSLSGNEPVSTPSPSILPSGSSVEKIIDLYEQLLKAEKEKVCLLERLLEEKGKNSP